MMSTSRSSKNLPGGAVTKVDPSSRSSKEASMGPSGEN